MVREIVSVRRRCGYRIPGGLYLVGPDADPGGVLPIFTTLGAPIPYDKNFFRGWQYVDGEAILNLESTDNWFVGSSQRTNVRKNSKAWFIRVFGMPKKERLQNGECAGMGVNQAIQHLNEKVAITNVLSDTLQGVLAAGLHEQAPTQYALFIQEIQAAGRGDCPLSAVVAALWRFVNALPKKVLVQQELLLVQLFAVLGIPKDAVYLRRKIQSTALKYLPSVVN